MPLDTAVFLAVMLCVNDGSVMLLEAVSYHLEMQVNYLALISNIV